MSRVKQPTWYKPENTQPKLKVYNTFTHEKVIFILFYFILFNFILFFLFIYKNFINTNSIIY
jgi:cell division protein FtsL